MPELPYIPGYEVQRGRVLLHAQWQGLGARDGRPFRVVAPTPDLLLVAVQPPTRAAGR